MCRPVYVLRQQQIGKNHVKSGHWKEYARLGGKAKYVKNPVQIQELGRNQGAKNVENGSLRKAREKSALKTRKPVRAIRDDIALEFLSLEEASKTLNITRQNISRCLRGGRPTAGGYCWEYSV
jgi:hypothetical protein